jgi:hypothetical protein
VEKSAARGTNCRFGALFRKSESHHFIEFFIVARRLLTKTEGAS